MDRNKQEEGSTNYQDMPHNEGAQQNIPPHGQPRSANNSHSMSDMLQPSPEQQAGREHEAGEGNRTQQKEDTDQ